MPDVRLFKEQKNLPVGYVVPASGTPVITDGIAIIRGGPNPDEARRFYEFVTTPESLHTRRTNFTGFRCAPISIGRSCRRG